MREISQKIEAAMPQAERIQKPGSTGGDEVRICTRDGSYCLNMRSHSDTGIDTMAAPTILGQCNHRPVFADVRYDILHIFTLDNEGNLRVEVSVDADGNTSYSNQIIGRMSAGECRGVRAGDFIVFTDSMRQLHYLEWNSRTGLYQWLGGVPELPMVSVSACGVNNRQMIIPAISFAKPVADIRAGVPDDVQRAVLEEVESAMQQTREIARETGHWIAPVMVRIAVRMWDGSLLHLSAPRLIAPTAFVTPRRVMLTVESGSDGATGTIAQRSSLPEYQIEVKVDTTALSAWGNIAQGVEVWVSREAEVMIEAAGSVAYNSSSRSLSVEPGFTSEEDMTRRMIAAEWVRVATLPCVAGETVSRVVNPSASGEQVMNEEEALSTGITHATAIAGHGDFLHLGGYRRAFARPMLPEGEADASETAQARVAVTISSLRGNSVVVAEGEIVADDGVLMPLLWYNDSKAVSILISLAYPDGRLYERRWDMVPARRGTGAYVPLESLDAVTLWPVDEWSDIGAVSTGDDMESTLVTMVRGNPFIVKSTTAHAGGRIAAIAAQQSGGGAYTRQYLYLFTDTGIVGVTHDMEGRHTNCRPLSRQIVSRSKRVAPTDNAVWAISDTGSLLRLTDAKVDGVLHGLPADYEIGGGVATGELWLMPPSGSVQTHSLRLETERGELPMVSESTWRPTSLLSVGNRLLGVTTRLVGGLIRREISEPALPKQHGARLDGEWLSGVIEAERGGLVAILLDIRGDSPSATIEVRGVPPRYGDDTSTSDEDVVLLSEKLIHSNGTILRIPLLLPDPKLLWQSSLRLRVNARGQFERIVSYGMTYLTQ